MRIPRPAHAVFAATFIALGILGLVQGDFAPLWGPVAEDVPARGLLVYLSALISLACGVGLFFARSARHAARALLAALLLWCLVFKLPDLFRAFLEPVSWERLGETTVIVAAAWVLYAAIAGDRNRQRLDFATGAMGVRIGRTLYGLSMIAFGQAHFAYLKLTADLVPAWLPAHTAWACLTGGAYIAAGLAILSGVQARLAAALCALQMGLFTLLVWVPVLAAGTRDPDQWGEGIVSWALSAAGWVVADSYRRGRALNPRSAMSISNQTAALALRTLPGALLLYAAATLLHFAHNAAYLAQYPNLPASWSATDVYLAWCALTLLGIAGFLLYSRGHRQSGAVLLSLYGALGFGGFLHYTRAAMHEHSATMNVTIWTEAAAAALLLINLAALRPRSAGGPGGPHA